MTSPTLPLLHDAAVQARAPDFSSREFRDALGNFATGIAIVSARDAQGALAGLTINSFSSVSLHPPLVLWSLACTSSAMQTMQQATHYAISVLGTHQQGLAERFATKGIDRWAGVAHTLGVHNTPLLADATATFECFNRRQYTEGDHVIFIAEVERCSHVPNAAPLLYHGGQFRA